MSTELESSESSEGAKIAKALGRAAMLRTVVGIGSAVAPILVLGWLCGSSLLAGLVHEELAAPVFWSQFLCFPFAAVAGGVGVGLLLRRLILAPYRLALDPLGPSSRYLLSGRKWTVPVKGHTAELRLARRSFFVVIDGGPGLDLRGGRDSLFAQKIRGDSWAVEHLDNNGVVLCKDSAALEGHLARAGVREAWQRLLGNDGRSLRSVHVKPGSGITLSMRHVPQEVLRTRVIRQWLEDLATVLDAA